MNAITPEWGVAEAMGLRVKRVLARNPSPYTYTGTQTYLVGTSDELIVVDPGPDDPEHLDALAHAVGKAQVVAICCTHTHRDHSPAARPLKQMTGAPIIGCASLGSPSSQNRYEAAFDPDYQPDRVLEDGETLRVKGATLTAIATPGHTSNHLCYALEEDGAVFTGDHVMGWSTTVIAPPDGNMAKYLKSLQKLYQREDKLYYPAHGPVVENPRQLVRGMIGHRRQRERQILKLLAEKDTTIPEMVQKMYRGLDERLQGAAAQSVLAHLIDLETRGQVQKDGEEAGISRWRIAA